MGRPSHLAFVRSLPCANCGRPPPSEAHHSTAHRQGKGTKADDLDTFPLCTKCHRDFHDARGSFRSWGKDKRRAWQRNLVALYRAKAPDHPDDCPAKGSEDNDVDPWGEIF